MRGGGGAAAREPRTSPDRVGAAGARAQSRDGGGVGGHRVRDPPPLRNPADAGRGARQAPGGEPTPEAEPASLEGGDRRGRGAAQPLVRGRPARHRRLRARRQERSKLGEFGGRAPRRTQGRARHRVSALPAGGGQALGVPGGAPGAAHPGVKAPALQAAPTIDQGATTSTGAGPTTEQPASAPGGVQADLSKIIRDGQIAVTIDDGTFKANAGSVAHIAAVNGGSILSSSTEGGDSGSFTLRIPAANFDKAMVQFAQLGTVDSSASQGQDVTAQYVDLQGPHEDLSLPAPEVLFGLMQQATTIGQTLTLAEPARRRAAEDRPDHRADELHQQAGSRVDDQGRPARAGRGSRGEPRRDRPPEPRARVGSRGARVLQRRWRRPLSASGT